MADNPKLELINQREVHGLEDKLVSEKNSVSDHVNGFHYTADNNNSDSFVIDMESFSNGGDKDIAANSIVKLQRSLSRKVCQRGSEKQSNSNKIANENRDSTLVGSSPRGSCTPEKATTVGVGTTEHGSNSPQVHHQITITAGNISTVADGRSILRRSSFKRSSLWVLDPRKIVFAFATLSSMGTILLIYLTLSISKYSTDENGLDWQQQ